MEYLCWGWRKRSIDRFFSPWSFSTFSQSYFTAQRLSQFIPALVHFTPWRVYFGGGLWDWGEDFKWICWKWNEKFCRLLVDLGTISTVVFPLELCQTFTECVSDFCTRAQYKLVSWYNYVQCTSHSASFLFSSIMPFFTQHMRQDLSFGFAFLCLATFTNPPESLFFRCHTSTTHFPLHLTYKFYYFNYIKIWLGG